MFQSLPGFREFYPEDCSIRSYLFKIFRQSCINFGFSEYDAPVLEPLELFTEKSGEEIVTQLFSFQDRGGRAVSLRPEMTPSLARLVGAKANSLKKPIKWFNISENFRYERPQKGRLRSFFQFNADILGETEITADAEAIALVISALKSYGLTDRDFCVRLSDRNLWMLFLETFRLKDEQMLAVLAIIDRLGKEKKEVILEKLSTIFGEKAENFFEKLQKLVSIRDLPTLSQFLKSAEDMPDGLLEKINLRTNDWEKLISLLSSMCLQGYVAIDLGIVRGLAYYTGFVFEAFEREGQSRALAGGGRYDNLVKKLAGTDVPAVGFAMGDVTLRDLLQEKQLIPPYCESLDFFFIITGDVERSVAMRDVILLRQHGFRVDYSLKNNPIAKQFKQADQLGARFVLLYGADEISRQEVKLRDLQTRQEKTFPLQGFAEAILGMKKEGIPLSSLIC